MQTTEISRIYKIVNGYIAHDPVAETDEFLDDIEDVVMHVASLAGDDLDVYLLLSKLAKEQKDLVYSRISLMDEDKYNLADEKPMTAAEVAGFDKEDDDDSFV